MPTDLLTSNNNNISPWTDRNILRGYMLIELGDWLLEISRLLKWAGSQIYKRITTNLGRYTHIHAIRESRETMDTSTRIKQHILGTEKNYTVLGHFVMLLMEQKSFVSNTQRLRNTDIISGSRGTYADSLPPLPKFLRYIRVVEAR